MKWRKWYFVCFAAMIFLAVCYRPALADDVSYSYDSLGRLGTITNNNGLKLVTMGINFDAAGNITRKDTITGIADADGDGMPDAWETSHGLNPNNPADALLDPDSDGLNNLAEYRAGTDPHNPDTDGDGVSDGAEVAAGTNPLDPASHPASDGDVPLMSDLAMGLLALLLLGLGMRNLPRKSGRNLFPMLLFFLAVSLLPHAVFAEEFGTGMFISTSAQGKTDKAETYNTDLRERALPTGQTSSCIMDKPSISAGKDSLIHDNCAKSCF